MKTHFLLWPIVASLGLAIFGSGYQVASAALNQQGQEILSSADILLAVQTPLPTSEPVVIGYPTPESRVLPPVGSNAGLVIGASVLVLIIIGGVLSARLRSKH